MYEVTPFANTLFSRWATNRVRKSGFSREGIQSSSWKESDPKGTGEPDDLPRKKGLRQYLGLAFGSPTAYPQCLCIWQNRRRCRCIGSELFVPEFAQTDSPPLFVPIWEIVRESFLQLSKEKPEGKKIIGVSGEGSEGIGYRQYILIWIDSASVLSVSETNYLKIIRVLSLKAFCLLLIPWFIFI